MRLSIFYTALISCLLLMAGSCNKEKKQELTPWGTPLHEDADTVTDAFTLADIQANGELIILTLNGPDTYYEYHGRGMGTQYLLCEKFAQTLGVSLRVEVCKDTTDLLNRLKKGEGDVIAIHLNKVLKGIRICGKKPGDKASIAWGVAANNPSLADTIDNWFKPSLLDKVKKEEQEMFSTARVKRHVYAPMLNSKTGVISTYDHLFQKHAPTARIDWRLLAAQCYQESTFDPKARSWVGACGLMQIMPETADRLGLSRAQLFEPEPNIAAATRYMADLDAKLRDIPEKMERTWFVLACYNGGYHHVRDAMALAKKNGRNTHRWSEVAPYVLKLRDPAYYKDPIVKYGYMRGNETVDYVERIKQRWSQYRGKAGGGSFSSSFGSPTPQRAKKQYRFHI